MSDSMLLQASGTQQFDALEPEDDLDAFNDDTFGGDADEWKEDDHEQLAQLTEQERQALAASNDFFEFGSDDEGDALEPVEPRNGTSSDKAPINQLSKLSLEPEGMAPPPEAVQGPLTIQTSIPVNQVPVVPQQILQPAYIQSQPMAYNLVPPAHFQAGGGGEGLQDPAIMSFSKVPQMPVQLHQVLPQQYQQVQPGGFPAVYQQQPQQQQQQFSSSGFPPGSGQPNFNQQQPASRPAFPQQSQQQFPPQQQGHTSIPPTIMGFKTIQDVEKEMMYGSQAAPAPQPNYMPRNDQQQHQQQHQARQQQQQQMHHQQQMQHQQQQQQHHQRQNHQQQQQQQQQILMNRNLSYPGMRDRQGHQVFNNINSRNHQENDNQRGHTNQNLNNWQQQQQNNRDHQHNNYNRLHESLRNAGRNNAGREDGRYNNRDGDRYGGGGRNDHYGRGGEDRFGRGGEGDRYGGGRGDNDRFNRDGGGNDRYGGGRDGDRYGNERELDEDSWRWNEVRNRNRDSNTRKDLMPGHVHVLGILRHSRSRHEHSEQHQDDDCLGSAEPLMDPTGDPLLDAKLSKEQAELANRCRYFDETEDEYAGLMSGRDKQFIINIQLSQLKCENPYVDDYYYTMYTAKKQHAENSESTGQMLLSEHGDHDAEYVPTQFSNSLGKLQAVTVKAPRQIIDVGVVRQETLSPTEEEEQHDPGLTVVKDVKRSGDYKAVLLQMERLYSTLLDIESLKLKLAAIPTGAPLREQVTLDLTKQIQALVTGLSKPGLITTYLQVRKGRGLLARCLKHLPGAAASRVSQEMLLHLGLMCREKSGQDAVWIHLHRHLAQCSLSSLETAMSGVCRGKESNLDNVLTSPLGVSTLLAILHRAATAAKRGQEKISVPVWRELILKVLAWRSKGVKVLAAPLLPPQPIDIGFLLTLPQDQMSAWEDFLATVSDDGSRDKN